MLKKVLEVYKVPFLLSFTLAIVLIALKVERSSLAFTLIVLGSLLGTFILDLDYLIYAYFLEPTQDFSIQLKGFIAHRDLPNAITYIQYHKNNIEDKILNSMLFQIVLAGAALFITSSNASFFIKALILSAFVNSMYKLVEEHLENRTDLWFWALKTKPNKKAVFGYLAVLFGILLYCLTLV